MNLVGKDIDINTIFATNYRTSRRSNESAVTVTKMEVIIMDCVSNFHLRQWVCLQKQSQKS